MRGRKWMRRTALAAGILAVPVVASLVYLTFRDYRSEFEERRGALRENRLVPAGGTDAVSRSWLTLTSSSGLRVECGVLAPRGAARRYPAIVLLGGKATGKHAVDYALDLRNVLIVAVDYPYEPRPAYGLAEILADVPAVRRALLDMPPSVMLVLDYLALRSDVDTARIVLLGYSFGAPLIPVIAANDRRAAAAVLIYGGGDLRSLIYHNVRRHEGPLLSAGVAGIGALLLHPLEPLTWAPVVAPVPVLMINGTRDEQVPEDNARRLFAAAAEPKRMIWIDSRHVHPRDTLLTRTIIDTLRQELARLGIF